MTCERNMQVACPLEPGQIVRSKAGRDRGKIFMVLEICDAKHVLLTDGKSRPVLRPKKKRIIHLQPFKIFMTEAAAMKKGPETDAYIRSKLASIGANKEES